MVDFPINVVVDATKAETGVKKVTDALGTAEKKAGDFGNTLTHALEAIVSFEAAKHLLEVAEAAEQIDARLRLVTESEEELASVTERLRTISHEGAVALEDTASLYQQLALSTKELGVSQEALLNFTRNLEVTIRASGASAGQQSSAFNALAFAMSTGTLNGRALRSILNEIPTVGDAIADHLGVTRSGLKALGDEGAISAKDLFDSLDHVSQKTEDLAKKSNLLSAAQNDVHNTLLQVVGDVDKATGTVHFLAEGVTELALAWGKAALGVHNYYAETNKLNEDASKVLQFNAQINETIFALQNLEGRKVISDEALAQIEKLRQRLALLRGEEKAGFSTPVLGGGATSAPGASASTTGAGVDLSGVVKAAQDQQHANEVRRNGDDIRRVDAITQITEKIESQSKVQEDLLRGDQAAAEVDKLIQAQAEKDKKNKTEINALDREGLILKQRKVDLQADDVKALQDVTGATQQYARESAALQRLEVTHPELIRQTERALNDLAIKYDEAQSDFGSGFERAFLKLRQEATDFASVSEKAVTAFADESTTAINKFAETGKFDLESFTNAFLDDLTKILIRELVVAAISSLIPGLGAGVGAAGAISGAHASGGTEQPGRSYLVGEDGPELHTPGQTGSTAPIGGGGAPPVVNVQVVNVDHPNKIPDAIASGLADQAIVNVLGRRRDQATKILSK